MLLVLGLGACVQAMENPAELIRRIEVLEARNRQLEAEKQQLAEELQRTREQLNQTAPDKSDLPDLFDLSLEELMEVEISSASLTETSRRKTPSTMTIITREDIQHSGARSLFELLEIYVPNFQWMYQGIFPRHMGLRGINDSRDDKYLLLVNGQQMNEKTNFGALSERDLPMLRDLQRIEVIRGPGSALYGPGALAMVINLIVDDPKTFQGTEFSWRSGFIEKYSSAEFKWSKMFSENEGLMVYTSGSIYPGAEPDDSPLRFAAERCTKYGTPYFVNDYYTGRMRNYNEAYRGLPKLKLHLHYTLGDLNIWARYTQGGEYADQSEWGNLENGLRPRDILYGIGYRQTTAVAAYTQEIAENFNLSYRFTYSRTQVESTPFGLLRELLYREDKYQGQILASWNLHDQHKVAFGAEWDHSEFGLDGDGEDQTMNYRFGDRTEMPRWGTDMKSVFGEYQWQINNQWTAFVSGRLDGHTYVEPMFSPRGTLVYTPDNQNTWKFMASKSSRTNVAQELKLDHLRGLSNSEPEILKAYEIRYERQPNPQTSWAASLFFHDHDVVSWSDSLGKTGPLGTFRSYGLELEYSYKTKDSRFLLSHTFTKLTDAILADGIHSTELTAAPNGYKMDFANWANHQTKLIYDRQFSEKLLWTNSFVIYWGYPGGEDYAFYVDTLDWARFHPKGVDAFQPSFFYNSAFEYKLGSHTTFRLDAYNLLGWLEKDAGKRKYGFTRSIPGMYRIQPPAFGLQIIHNF